MVTMLLLGVTAASFHARFSTTVPLGKAFSGQIVGVVERIEYRVVNGRAEQRWTVSVEGIKGLDPDSTPKKLLLVRKSSTEPFHVGERLQMRAHLTPLQRPAYPGGFDYGRYLWVRAIGGQGYLSKDIKRLPAVHHGGFEGLSKVVRLEIEQVRHRIAIYLKERLSDRASGLAIALAVGKRDYLDHEIEDALRQSGLAHILAISGMHMALVAMSIFWGARFLFSLLPAIALHKPTKQWAAVLALICAFGYLILSGSSVATLRAFLMTSVFLVAILAGRPALTMHNLCLSMIILIVVQPYSIVEAGMQMSFAATAALIATYDRLRRRDSHLFEVSQLSIFNHDAISSRLLMPIVGAGRWIAGIGVTSLIAGLAVLPFSVAHFQQMAPLDCLPISSLCQLSAWSSCHLDC